MIIKEWLIHFIKIVAKQILKITYLLPVYQNRVFFGAYSGKQYACNPRYIYEALLSKYPGKFEMIWMIDHDVSIPGTPVLVKRNTVRYCYFMLTSHVIVSNGGFNVYLPYKKKQLKINTWHGGGAYKKCGLDTAVSPVECRRLKTDGANTDVVISSNKRFSKVFPPSCGIAPQKVWEIGLPRNDMMINAKLSERNRIFEKLGLKPDEKLVLYAPTYRGSFSHATFDEITFDHKLCKKALSERFGGNWILGFRMHYAYNSDLKGISDSINLSEYPDMQELLLVADAFITDYSSSIWDFSLTQKPCFIWATDLERYKSDVDFYTPIEQWPFPIAKNNHQLAENILNFNENSYRQAINQHHKELGDCETGRASEIVADAIFDYCFHGLAKEELPNRR